MIQDIYPHVFDNSYHDGLIPAEIDRFILYSKEGFILKPEQSGEIVFPGIADIKGREDFIYLFSIDDIRYFTLEDKVSSIDGFDTWQLRYLRSLCPSDRVSMFALYTGWHLINWYENSRYCGHCGQKMKRDDRERAMLCPECGNKVYPRLNPAVIVGVTNGDKIVVTRYNRGFSQNALIAGFTEIGETLEECVRREVMEETGLKVKNIRYYKSQPWGIAADILSGFYCEVDGSDEIRVDHSELKSAMWTAREDIVLQSDDLSLTNEMMRLFKDGEI